MMNFLGKLMVQLHLVVCMLAFGWASSLYFELIDWGWKTPLKDLDYVVASEIDKRLVQQKEAYRRRDDAYAGVKDVWTKVREAEEYFAQNSLWYEQEMTRLAADPNKIEVKELKFVDGFAELTTAGSPLGKPVYQEKPIPEITKSYRVYLQDLKKIEEKAKKVDKALGDWQDKQKDNTETITGTVEKGRPKPGLFELRQREIKSQEGILDEIRYLGPREVDFRKEAEIYRERRELLEQDLANRVRLLKK